MNQNETPQTIGEIVSKLVEEGSRYWQAGDIEAATSRFLEVRKHAPQNKELLAFTAYVAMTEKQYQVAIAQYETLLTQIRDDVGLWFNYGMALYENKEHSDALRAFERCLSLQPGNIPALLYRGLTLERLNENKRAVHSFVLAVRRAEKENAAKFSPLIQGLLGYAAASVKKNLDHTIESYLQPSYDQYGKDAVSRIRRCADYFVGKTPPEFAHPKWRPGLFYVPGLPPKMFYERDELPQLKQLEAATDIIRQELLSVMKSDEGFRAYVNHPTGSSAAETWKDLNQSMAWSTFHFFRHGGKNEENCLRCPQTTAILQSLDLVRIPGYGPEAMFSVLAPHTRIKAHYGAINGRLTIHLPLIVPKDCGFIRVSDQQRSWTEGECLAFDDSFEHEAWNDSDQTRVVLILDMWNPNLTMAERAAFIALHQAAQDFENGIS